MGHAGMYRVGGEIGVAGHAAGLLLLVGDGQEPADKLLIEQRSQGPVAVT